MNDAKPFAQCDSKTRDELLVRYRKALDFWDSKLIEAEKTMVKTGRYDDVLDEIENAAYFALSRVMYLENMICQP